MPLTLFLNDKLTEINGLQGQVIIMNVQTGEILAMAGRERNFEGKFQPCQNFAYQQELGSLMKTASLLIALETGKAHLSDVVDTGEGVWQIDDDRIMKDHNWRRGGYGEMTLDRTLEVSSNIGIGKTIWKLFKGQERDFFSKLDSMSFGQPSSIEGIEGLRPSIYNSPKDSDWVNKDILWSAIGYNRKIAPIQMLTFYNAIANNGKMVKPTLVPGTTEVINEQIAKKENIALMQQTLEHVVSQGLGSKAGSYLIQVAGKTGTSQVNEYYEGDNTVSEYQLVIISNTNELVRVRPERIVYVESDGNYSTIVLHDKTEYVFTMNLAHCQQMMEDQLGKEAMTFIRIGKSLIVNRAYIFKINVNKQQLVMSNMEVNQAFTLQASKEALKQLKTLIESEKEGKL